MNGLKSGALLLLLGIPFALYAAWQVHRATPIDTGAPEPPADKSASKEQLAAARTKAAALSGESRKAVEVSWQYRTAVPADNSPDPTVTAVVKAASARSADLTDLDRFLSAVKEPTFNGNAGLKKRYTEWAKDLATRETDAQAVTKWLSEPLTIVSVDDAGKALDKVSKLINDYSTRSQFADKGKATDWRIRGRIKAIDGLTALADAQYATTVSANLPLPKGAGESAIATLKELKTQLAALGAELATAKRDKVTLDPEVRALADAKSGNADEYTAREELLALFAKPDLFTNASGAAPWLKQVAAQYKKMDKNPKVQSLIRDKVQQFADAFIPSAARLDDEVLIRGKPVPRAAVRIKFEKKPGGGYIVPTELLADAAAGFNEFEFARKPPGFNTLVTFAASEYDLKDLAPTERSKAAVAFNAARAKFAASTPAPRWTGESVAELKKACEVQKDLVDQLRTLDTGTVPKIATRVAGLVAGMDACKELFEVVP